MLLDWISDEMSLISSSLEKNMLKNFPLSVKRVVVGSVVKYFDSQHDEAVKTLLTQNHINWVMEIIGMIEYVFDSLSFSQFIDSLSLLSCTAVFISQVIASSCPSKITTSSIRPSIFTTIGSSRRISVRHRWPKMSNFSSE